MSVTVATVGDALPPALLPERDALAPVIAEGSDGWVFEHPGLASLKGDLLVVLPHGHRAPPAPDAAALRLLRALLAYRRDRKQRSVEDGDADLLDNWGDDAAGLEKLEARLLLWEDWKANGALTLSTRQRAPNAPGRIHWPRTLAEGLPITTSSGIVSRLHVTERVRRQPRHPLALLHQQAVLEAGHQLNFLPQTQPPISRSEARSVLDRWGPRQFADRPRRVVAWLRQLLRGGQHAGQDEQTARLFFATTFHTVWERMLQVALGHRLDQASTLKGTIAWAGPQEDTKGMHLIPDVVVPRPGGRLLILDAKDYRTGHFPRTPDISKQLLYRLAFSDRLHPGGLPLDRIGNAFLFPGAADPVRVRAVHTLRPPAPPALSRVVGLDTDVVRVMDAWNSGRVDPILVEAVDDAIRSAA